MSSTEYVYRARAEWDTTDGLKHKQVSVTSVTFKEARQEIERVHNPTRVRDLRQDGFVLDYIRTSR